MGRGGTPHPPFLFHLLQIVVLVVASLPVVADAADGSILAFFGFWLLACRALEVTVYFGHVVDLRLVCEKMLGTRNRMVFVGQFLQGILVLGLIIPGVVPLPNALRFGVFAVVLLRSTTWASS